MRDKLIEGGYKLPLIFAIIVLLLLGLKVKAQTKEEVYKFCDKIGIKHAEIVVNQSLLETGHYQCENCSLDHNNIFGFRYKKKYLEFNSWKESCLYYLKWQRKRYDGKQDYYEFLKCVQKRTNGDCTPYATSKQYINKLKQF